MKKLTKQEYAKRMSEQRSSLFALANNQLKIITSDPYHFINYLSLMASTNYTVNNSLLVYGQRPHFKELKSLDKWAEIKVKVNKGEKGIQIMEPSSEYTRADGSKGLNYTIRYVFDISQTDGKEKKYSIDKELLKDVLTKAVPSYQQTTNNEDDVINGLFKAIALSECKKHLQPNQFDFMSNCIGYMLSIRFHIPNYNTSIINGIMSNYFKNMDERQIRNELNFIFNIYKPIKDSIHNEMRNKL